MVVTIKIKEKNARYNPEQKTGWAEKNNQGTVLGGSCDGDDVGAGGRKGSTARGGGRLSRIKGHIRQRFGQ